MAKKNPEVTPLSKIKNMVRQCWLRSRERASALKRDKYTCCDCHRKQSKAKGKEFKVQVHHINGIDWDGICQHIRENVLQTPDKYITLCEECHDKKHGDKNG